MLLIPVLDVKVPLAILAAEVDHATPPKLVEEFQAVLEGKKEVKRQENPLNKCIYVAKVVNIPQSVYTKLGCG
jgi:poly(3-hydroxyalkanoate) synthetase